MNAIDAVILGVVEGLTEFLPISSTAHLVIVSRFLDIQGGPFLSSFVIAIQLGAIASVVFLYWKTLFFNLEIFKRITIAFIPTAIVGFVLYQLLKDYLLESLMLIAWAMLIGGIVLVVFERWYSSWPPATAEPLASMSYTQAFLIGCAQSLAIIPGVSRAGATILGGLTLGIGRKEIVEFSFLVAIPTMFAATGYDLLRSASTFASEDWEMLAIGFVISFVSAYAAVRWLLRYIQTHSFAPFGWYRVGIGTLLLIFLAL